MQRRFSVDPLDEDKWYFPLFLKFLLHQFEQEKNIIYLHCLTIINFRDDAINAEQYYYSSLMSRSLPAYTVVYGKWESDMYIHICLKSHVWCKNEIVGIINCMWVSCSQLLLIIIILFLKYTPSQKMNYAVLVLTNLFHVSANKVMFKHTCTCSCESTIQLFFTQTLLSHTE